LPGDERRQGCQQQNANRCRMTYFR
jgi:hypothetical protein